MEHSDCDAAGTHSGCVRVCSRADDGVQFARLDPHYGDGHRAAIGRTITGRCTTSRSDAGRATFPDMRARRRYRSAVCTCETATRTCHRQGMADHAYRQ